MNNQNFPKYIKSGNAVCILVDEDNTDFLNAKAKYVGYTPDKQVVILLVEKKLPFYNVKFYQNFKLICDCIVVEHFNIISPKEFYENAHGYYADKYRNIAFEDMKKDNKYLKWTI
ncbi:MAG: hypothetical protein [Wendovervirus sonii]|uniref:Uncharacterized protein n=1 Tax=phage Lak_Megaphage_Sonny TaxID=3109229 RepID=A0ABZ0Z2E3_9CAUD|nr:MAG: hypothetical protein [phage Lak_Megaphage_Sonny]